MGLSKGGKLWTSPSGLISPSTELWERGCAADGEKKTGDILKGKEVADRYSVMETVGEQQNGATVSNAIKTP